MHRLKKWTIIPGALVFGLLIWQYELISYGLSQGYGQLRIIYNSRPVEEFLQDPAFPDSLKQKILLVQEIRQFSIDSLGLNYSDNYTTLYDQQGKAILWIVTAAPPFELKAIEWKFPFLGSFSYKGYFNYERALKEKKKLESEGYDTSLDEVGGWSTLGWFKDPILSKMLNRSPGSLANLIIHELTHGTLYIKNNVEYNENLASFVGDHGASVFLKHKYGEDSREYIDYKEGRKIMDEYTEAVLRCANRLDSLYAGFNPEMSEEEKMSEKEQMIHLIRNDLTVYLNYFRKKNPGYYEKAGSINNTYFLDFRRYRENLGMFENEFREEFNSDFRLYMEYLKKKYPSM